MKDKEEKRGRDGDGSEGGGEGRVGKGGQTVEQLKIGLRGVKGGVKTFLFT